jgi:Cys-rich four helix bundle protein (predicted Tat secretion target)
MDRRSVLAHGIATSAGVVLAQGFLAKAQAKDKPRSLVETATDCLSKGERCAQHCRSELKKGNKAMAECLETVEDMLAAVAALVKIAAHESKHLAAFAKVCGAMCRDCIASCEPHVKHMVECQDCLTACEACEKACREHSA